MKLPTNLAVLLEFFKTTGKLKSVLRHNKATKKRRENSAEHSWSVALFAWAIADELEKDLGTKLNQEKMIKMALIHDLVEIHVGDNPIWKPKNRLEKQQEQEKKAAQKLFAQLPKKLGQEMYSFWLEFEADKTPEAKIVKSLDWLSAMIQKITTLQGWLYLDVDIKQYDEKINTRIKFSKTFNKIYQNLRKEVLDKGLMKK